MSRDRTSTGAEAGIDLGQSVKRIAGAAQAAGLVGECATVQATVLEHGAFGVGETFIDRPLVVEVEGLVYRIADDQERARASLARQGRDQRLRAALADQPNLLDLLTQVLNDHGEYLCEDFTDQVREFGRIITGAGQTALWREVYRAFVKGCVYQPGDELSFLVEE